MRTDERLLVDIVEAADEIADFIAGFDEGRFLDDPIIQRAVLFNLIVIGEAANALSGDLRAKNSQVNWRGAIDMRNFAVHAYFAVSYARIWETITGAVPAFRAQIVAILEEGFQGGHES